MGAEQQADSLDEEEAAIVMEIAEVIERGRKDKLPALRNVPKKKLLEETAKVDKVLSKFKTHSIIKTNELTLRVFSEDIRMEFGIEKCTMLVMEKGKIVKSELSNGEVIKSLQEGESYKCFGILEAD